MMSMVKTEDSVKMVVNMVRDGKKALSDVMVKSLNEYIFSLAFTGNASLKMMETMKVRNCSSCSRVYLAHVSNTIMLIPPLSLPRRHCRDHLT